MFRYKVRFLLVALITAGSPAASELSATTEENWFQVNLLGEAAGSVEETIVRDHGSITEISSHLRIRVQRFGDIIEIHGRDRFSVETPPRLHTWLVQAEGDTLERVFVFGPDSLRWLHANGSSETLAPLPPDLLLPPAVESWFAGTWSVGETRIFSEFSSDIGMLVRVHVTAEAHEDWTWDDTRISGLRFAISIEDLPELGRIEWRAEDGRLFRARTSVLGLELVRSVAPVALETAAPSLDPAILMSVGFDFGGSKVYERIRYRASWNPDRAAFRPLLTPGLRIVSSHAEECLFEIERVDFNSDSDSDSGFADLTESEREDAGNPVSLASSDLIESDDPRIIEAAEDAIGGATRPWEQVKRLTRFVHNHIEEKSFEVYFASARTTLDAREGDCTEHAVLLAALARAVDIPARVVSGWIGIGDQMGYHLWTEVNVDGNWIGVDGVFARAPTDARYVPLAVSDLAYGSTNELTLAVLRNLGGLRLDVLEAIETAP